MLLDLLFKVADEYSKESTKPFAKSEFANFVRKDLVEEARKHLTFHHVDLLVKASVGQGVWASVPWLAFFDPLETTSATKGIYVVYLINPRVGSVSLSLNQGTTEIYNEFGESRGRSVLERRATDMADRVPEYAKHFSREPINLSSNASLPTGYVAGHSFGRTYYKEKGASASFADDLTRILGAYDELLRRGGNVPTEVMQGMSGISDIRETRRYVMSRRIERSADVRKKVLSCRPLVCEGCGMDPKLDYGYAGKPNKTLLDVHHAAPISGMEEGTSRRYIIPDDFLVLCPTCHRMIHKQDDPSDLVQLKRSIKFKLARQSTYSLL